MRVLVATERSLAPLLLAAISHLVAYGWAALLSVVILFEGYGSVQTSGSMSDSGAFVAEATLIVVGLLVAAAAIGLLGRSALREWFVGRRPRRRGRGPLVAGLLLVSDLAGFWLFVWINPPQPLQDPTAHTLWYDIARGLLSGAIGEELIVLALPVVIARRFAPHLLDRTRSAAVFVAVLVVLRIGYHLYQGAWAWSHVPWAVVAVLLYLWSGRVWPQIVAHAFYDTTLALNDHHVLSQLPELVLLHAVAVALVALGTVMLFRGRHKKARPVRQLSSPR